MDEKVLKKFSGYDKLWKTKKALDLFLTENNYLSDREEILKYYVPKTTKRKNKVTRLDLADRIFSEYVRLFYCDKKGYCKCITCGGKFYRTDIQNGHYRSRGHYPTRFNIDNCHPQCSKCNLFLNGNYRNYHKAMIEMYGEEKEEYLRNNNETANYNQSRYEDHILNRYNYVRQMKNNIKNNEKIISKNK